MRNNEYEETLEYYIGTIGYELIPEELEQELIGVHYDQAAWLKPYFDHWYQIYFTSTTQFIMSFSPKTWLESDEKDYYYLLTFSRIGDTTRLKSCHLIMAKFKPENILKNE